MLTATTHTHKKILVPLLKKGTLNIYSPQQINAVGGIEKFLDLVAQKQPIPMPDFGFTEAEWQDMEKYLRDDS